MKKKITSLKNKVLVGVPFILIAVMLIATIVVSIVIGKQSRRSANQLLKNAVNTIRHTLAERGEKLIFDAQQMAKLNDMGGKLKYLAESKMYFKYEIMRSTYVEAASVLYSAGTTLGAWKTAVYDMNGGLIAFTIIGAEESTLGYIHSGNREIIEIASLKPYEELTHESWTRETSAPVMGTQYGKKIITEGLTQFEVVDHPLCVVAYVPITGKEYNPQTEEMEFKQVGMMLVVQKLDDTFAKGMAELTGTEINIFTKEGIVAGTQSKYDTFNLEAFKPINKQWDLAEQEVTFNEIDIENYSYFQSVLPIYSGSECVATIVSLYSKEITKSNTMQVIKLLSAVYLVCILLIVPLTIVVVVRGVIIPIQSTASMVRDIAGRKGDLTKTVKISGEDEIAQLALAFNDLIKSMSEIVTMIRDTSDKVTTSSQSLSSTAQEMNASTVEISNTIQRVSKGVSEQAAKIETTSRIMEEMSTSVKQVSTNAQAAAASSKRASETAGEGGTLAHEAVKRMAKINEVIGAAAQLVQSLAGRSQQIFEIVDVLTSIADQTNLLALNAAIEAARAGEAGRGFAVVAEEVRKLAEGSATSAKDIARLVSEIQKETTDAASSMEVGTKEVAQGTQIVNRVGSALGLIVKAAQEASQMVSQIASATVQQLEGTQNVVKSVSEIANIAEQSASAAQEATASTQEQTASMEEMASGAQELSRMAVDLKELVAKFKLER